MDVPSPTLATPRSSTTIRRGPAPKSGIGAGLGVSILALLLAIAVGACSEDDSITAPEATEEPSTWVHRWNRIAVDASGIDHTVPRPGDTRVYGEQLGPGRSSRAMAIAHIAMFEAVNAITGGYESYVGLESPARRQLTTDHSSLKAAIAQATYDALAALYPSQRDRLHDLLDEDLHAIPRGEEKELGIALGRQAAAAILELRAQDGSDHEEPRVGIEYIPGDQPGEWRQDPINRHEIALGAHWGQVEPFLLESASQFRAEPPPSLDSREYAAAFNEVKAIGGDENTPNVRTEDDTITGLFWAYDGMPSLCAPPRLYNQIATVIADQQGTTDPVELARLFALLNVALADAGIAVWESKYYYEYWRPVCGIREADPGTGPSDLGDGNPETIADSTWSPLGAPASNSGSLNFTPPFPAYPSGHACFGGALFQTLRRYYGTDAVAFEFVSDEFNGITQDNEGNVRPRVVRHFSSLSEAEEENGQSRIFLGIHWSFDKTSGIEQGRKVADVVLGSLFQPIPPPA